MHVIQFVVYEVLALGYSYSAHLARLNRHLNKETLSFNWLLDAVIIGFCYYRSTHFDLIMISANNFTLLSVVEAGIDFFVEPKFVKKTS